MQLEFLDLLTPAVQQLVQEIEEQAGVDIQVVVDPERANHEGPGTLGAEANQQGARILTGAANHFPDASVYHELRHIQRVIVEGVPRLIACPDFEPWDPGNDEAMAGLDNNIEHFFIVPDEIALYPERRDWWESRHLSLIEKLEGEGLPADDRWRFALLAWLLVNDVVASPPLVQRTRSVLQQLNMNERAAAFRDDIAGASGSKEAVVRVVFEYLELENDLGCLRRYYTQTGAVTDVCLDEPAD